MTIYADANGSYDIPMALRIGHIMEEHGLAFLEEPVPFDYYDETKRIADALSLPVAGGEQESSLRRFRWMIEQRCVDVVQPDLFYFGGFVRSIRVARMAAAAGLLYLHLSDGGPGYLYVAHFASCCRTPGRSRSIKGAIGRCRSLRDVAARQRQGRAARSERPGPRRVDRSGVHEDRDSAVLMPARL